jgi:hypothetical protein
VEIIQLSTSEHVYSGVVRIETVRTILALSAIEPELQVVAADTSYAFLYGKNTENTLIKAGPDFGELQDQYLIEKVVGTAIKRRPQPAHLAAKLRKIGFVPNKADLDWKTGHMNKSRRMSMTYLWIVRNRWS